MKKFDKPRYKVGTSAFLKTIYTHTDATRRRIISMMAIPFYFAAILTLLDTSVAFIPPAGKCKNITGTQVDDNDAMNVQQWYAIYYPAGEEFNKIDSDYEDYSVISENEVQGVHRIRRKDNSVTSYTYKYTLGPDNVIYEEVIGENGQKLVFRIYILDLIYDELSFLYYRCIETGGLDYDTRYIALPRGNCSSAEGERQLVAKDATYNFTGGIQKLDNKLLW